MNSDDIRRAHFPASSSRAVVSPIQPSVVYASEDADALDAQYEGRAIGYTYAREGHPNADTLAGLIDQMEGAEDGLIVGSGMAAVTVALLAALKTGDHVLGSTQLYGRSLRLLNETLPTLGIATSLADTTDLASVRAALRKDTKLILVETVSNPTLRITDLVGIAKLAAEREILLAVDNTFTTPRGLNPFEHGADIVIHSVTKLLAGHSDATLGYAAARSQELREKMRTLAVTMGFTPSPFDCWLAERGLYSFSLRHDRAVATAVRLANALSTSSNVARVIYPTRSDHPDHNRAASLLAGRGGNMVSFEIKGGRKEVNRFLRACPSIPFAPTLGDIGTTISHPASSSHRALSEDHRLSLGIPEGLLRLSVGCEEPEALITTILHGLGNSD